MTNVDKRENFCLSAMKFGSEEDFKIAVTELKWIIHTSGKATKSDFEAVSSKYDFPIDFLKEGLNGDLEFPDGFKVSKSKWFPILYSWAIQRGELSYKHFRFQIEYLGSRFSLMSSFAVLLGASQVLILFLREYFMLDLKEVSLLVVSFVLFFVALFFEMKDSVSEKKIALDEYSYFLKQKGLAKIVKDNEDFVKKNIRLVIYAGGILKKKLEEAENMTIFSFHVKNGAMIVDDWEDVNLEYRKRVIELEKT